MGNSQLNPEILKYLSKKTDREIKTVRNNIALFRRKYPSLPLNAVAHLYALSFGHSVLQKLSKEERQSLPHIEIEKSKTKINEKKPRKKPANKIIIEYESGDYFIKGHIKEINKAYTEGCYTSVHILSRKIIENLIREILVKQFPEKTSESRELYYDTTQRRFKDFSVILKNLFDKRNSFDGDKKTAIERLYNKAKKFKDDANDATHSWYYLIETKSEVDDLKLQSIIELIKTIEK